MTAEYPAPVLEVAMRQPVVLDDERYTRKFVLKPHQVVYDPYILHLARRANVRFRLHHERRA